VLSFPHLPPPRVPTQVTAAVVSYTLSLVTVVITIRSGDLIQRTLSINSGEIEFWRAMSHLRTAITLLAWCLSVVCTVM
jgi:hypothetical protein